MSKYWFCKMREETYASIPYGIRQEFISERVIHEETEEMKKDETYLKLRKKYYKAKEEFNKRKFELKHPVR